MKNLENLSRYKIYDALLEEIKNIVSENNAEKAKSMSGKLRNLVAANEELHWTLYISRLIVKSVINNCEDQEECESINEFSLNFDFNDNDQIAEQAIISMDLEKLNQIDFLYNTAIDVWIDKKGEQASFIDCVSEIWKIDGQLTKTLVDSRCFFENCMITSILANLKNYTRSKYDLDATDYAKLIWTILENHLELTNSEVLKSEYNVEDEGRVLAVDTMTFCLEKILACNLEEKFLTVNALNGYSNDHILISEELLDRDIFDE
jgi:hypothetical protein